MNKSLTNNIHGIMFMLLDALSVSILFTAIKFLTKDIPSNQVVFLYKFIVLIAILPWIFKDGFKALRTQKFPLYLIGGIFSTIASLCLMHSFKYIPLANATSLNYLEKVLLAAAGIICFHEKFSITKLAAIITSFIGAIIVVQPNIFTEAPRFITPDKHYLFIFASIILWVIYCITVKILGRTEATKTQVFYAIGISTIVSFPAAFINWQPGAFMGVDWMRPEGFINLESFALQQHHLPLLLLVCGCYLTRSIASFKAMKCGDLSVIMPFGYSKILFTGLMGFYIFNETPSFNSCIGYLLIIASGICLIRAERKKAEQ